MLWVLTAPYTYLFSAFPPVTSVRVAQRQLQVLSYHNDVSGPGTVYLKHQSALTSAPGIVDSLVPVGTLARVLQERGPQVLTTHRVHRHQPPPPQRCRAFALL